jgi:hypothetical protein
MRQGCEIDPGERMKTSRHLELTTAAALAVAGIPSP